MKGVFFWVRAAMKVRGRMEYLAIEVGFDNDAVSPKPYIGTVFILNPESTLNRAWSCISYVSAIHIGDVYCYEPGQSRARIIIYEYCGIMHSPAGRARWAHRSIQAAPMVG